MPRLSNKIDLKDGQLTKVSRLSGISGIFVLILTSRRQHHIEGTDPRDTTRCKDVSSNWRAVFHKCCHKCGHCRPLSPTQDSYVFRRSIYTCSV